MLWLALKTLLHEKARLIITVFGVAFSTVLVLMQVGMYIGFMGNATNIVRHVDADIWVASKKIQCFDFVGPFPEERINRVRSHPEVLRAEKLILTMAMLKLPAGGVEQVQILGFNPASGVGAPWSMLEGGIDDVKGGRYMIMDKTSEQRFGSLNIGSIWELGEIRFKLVGLSNGIRNFINAPIVFISYDHAREFINDNQTSFIVAKVRDIERLDDTVKSLKSQMRNNDVYTRRDFIYKTVFYWTVQTGMGMGFFLTAVLGLAVGGAIVGQTIYTNTMEHLRELGTLKAMGAKNSDIYKMIFIQTGVSVIIGYAAGSLLLLMARQGMEEGGVNLYLGFWVFVPIFLIILSTCFIAAFFSIRKVRKLDPVMVFRG
ncbi:MAG: FtsX-like permease family protein [Nitrospirae bacterium]|nr:FtsX-like permease family protein [Nitrospirota bacterium]